MADHLEKFRFKPISMETTRLEVWQERDRLHIGLVNTQTDQSLWDWWDDDAREMFEDGFFETNMPFGILREGDRKLHESVLEYYLDVLHTKVKKPPLKPLKRKGARA